MKIAQYMKQTPFKDNKNVPADVKAAAASVDFQDGKGGWYSTY